MKSIIDSHLRRHLQKTVLALVVMIALLAGSVPAARAQAPGLFSDAPPLAAAAQAASARRTRYVHVDLSQLMEPDGQPRDASALPHVTLNLFPDVTYTGSVLSTESDEQHASWRGTLDGVDGSYFYMVVYDGVFIAHVASLQGIYEVSSAGGDVYRVDQIDQSKFKDARNDAVPVFTPPDQSSASSDPVMAADSASQIDVLIVYTDDARAAEGGTAAMKARVQLAVDEANGSYANAGITTRLRLVHTQEVSYGETGLAVKDLGRLRKTSDGILDSVPKLRNKYGADMVQLIVNNLDACGIGYMMTSVSHTFAPYAYSVVMRDCMTGYYSTAHEFGHNQAADHDMFVAAGDTTAYSYAHGYVFIGATAGASWRTVMAYANRCQAVFSADCNRLQYFSNPNKTYGGDAMGNTKSRNYLVLNKTASTVANFRSRIIAGDFNSQFTSDHNGWSPVSGSWALAGSATYQTHGVDGKYSSIKHSGKFGDFDYIVRMRRTGGDVGDANALFVRGNSGSLTSSKAWKPGYIFQYSNSGSFSVWRVSPGGTFSPIVGWTASGAILSGNWNVLEVKAAGSLMAFYINGSLVWSGSDSNLSVGQVGIGMHKTAGSAATTLDVDYATLSTDAIALDPIPSLDATGAQLTGGDWTHSP